MSAPQAHSRAAGTPPAAPDAPARPESASWTRLVLAALLAAGVLQVALWSLYAGGLLPDTVLIPGLILIGWAAIATVVWLADRRSLHLRQSVVASERHHLAAVAENEELAAHNEMLQALARSTDVTLAFQALARRISRIVPCDRVGLALLKEGGQDFQTFTARVAEPERRARPRMDLEFSLDRTHLGEVVRTGQSMIVDDFATHAAEYLDANVLLQTGFHSGLVVPLISKNKAIGTLNAVSRSTHAFTDAHRRALEPIAEILAVAYVAQQLQQSLARFRTMEAMADLTLSIASEIQSALQTIIGHCDLLERGYPDAALQRDAAMITRQAQRIQDLLERMRTAAQDRLREIAEQVRAGIPSSPEAFSEETTGSTFPAETPGTPER